MNILKNKYLPLIFLIISAISLVLYLLYGWPLLLLLFIPGLIFPSRRKPQPLDNQHCRNCQSVIDPKWKYCPFCSSRI